MMLSNDLMNLPKGLLNKRGEEQDRNINPYANLIFNDKWKSLPSLIPYPSQPKHKQSNYPTSIKAEILKWY